MYLDSFVLGLKFAIICCSEMWNQENCPYFSTWPRLLQEHLECNWRGSRVNTARRNPKDTCHGFCLIFSSTVTLYQSKHHACRQTTRLEAYHPQCPQYKSQVDVPLGTICLLPCIGGLWLLGLDPLPNPCRTHLPTDILGLLLSHVYNPSSMTAIVIEWVR